MRRFWWFPLLLTLVACARVEPAGSEAPGALAAIGAQLFTDPRLSADGTTSCATCHDPALAFTDARAVSIGVFGRAGTRNAPSLLDLDHDHALFWEGRETDLAQAVLQPFTNPTELGHADLQAVVDAVRALPTYREDFEKAIGRAAPEAGDIGAALVAYLQRLDRGSTRFERAQRDGRLDALLSQEERAGLALFSGKAQCASCHTLGDNGGPFTDHRFHHAGIGFERIAGNLAPLLSRIDDARKAGAPMGQLILQDAEVAELGRFVVSGNAQDIGAFRTPTLRNVANTAPYMHDGSVPTLEAAIERELYYRGLFTGRPVQLTVEEQRQLAAFLRTLSIE